jgi:hypothetical protein
MARPSLSVARIASLKVQSSARIRLESVHDHLRANVRFQNYVHAIRSHVGSQEIPIAILTDLAQSIEYGGAAGLVQVVGSLVHLFAFDVETLRTGFRERASKEIMIPVYDTGFVAV